MGMFYFKIDKDISNNKILSTINIAPITTDDIKIKLKSDEANVIRIVNQDLVTEKNIRIVGFEKRIF